MMKYLELMRNFDESNLPGLSEAVLGALELFISEGLPNVKIPNYKKPVIVGSGNAEVTAKILFGNSECIFANENNYKEAIKRKGVEGVIIFSASGEKHGAIVAKYCKKLGIKTTLVTCNANSSAAKVLGSDNAIVTAKNREPYTYNTSTYLGWILAITRENPKKIYDFILDNIKVPKSISNFEGYLLVTPEKFASCNRLFEVKFIELFARRVARDVRTYEEMKHAITVVPYEKELCIAFGDEEVTFPKSRTLRVPLPKGCSYGTMMAIAYYVIGEIAKGKPQWFKENIGKFISELNKTEFGKNLKVIVE